MIKLLWRFFLLVLLAAGFAWIADRPGTLTIRWLGREIQMSFIAGVVLAVLAVVADLVPVEPVPPAVGQPAGGGPLVFLPQEPQGL